MRNKTTPKVPSSFGELILSLKAKYLGEQYTIESLYRLHEISSGWMASIQGNLIHANNVLFVLGTERTHLYVGPKHCFPWTEPLRTLFFLHFSKLALLTLLGLIHYYWLKSHYTQFSLSRSHFWLFKWLTLSSQTLVVILSLIFRKKTYLSYFSL